MTGTVLVKGGDMGEVLDCGRNPTGYLLALLLYCVGAHFWVALMVPDAQLLRF